MRKEVKIKLRKIADIWSHYIWEYNICRRKVKFDSALKKNYLGDIIGYFQDTFDIIYNDRKSSNYADRFSNQISLLQSIYIQQDFIEEMLRIFRCGIQKGDLKKDPNYYKNRNLRNELVGHPVRRINGEFISSALFGYNGDSSKIVYLLYHKDNNFEFENKEFQISYIVEEHTTFLNNYFQIILDRLQIILIDFVKETENIDRCIKSQSLERLLDICELKFESILKYDYCYDKDSLLRINSKKEEHPRYKNFIESFYLDLEKSLEETKNSISNYFKVDPNENLKKIPNEMPIFTIQFDSNSKVEKVKSNDLSYHYELGKIATKRNLQDFEFYSGFLKRKCKDMPIILNELNHMKENICDPKEYYCSFRLISKKLREE